METIVGTEWVIDAWGCDEAMLRDRAALAAVFDRAVAEIGLTPLGEAVWHRFPEPGGLTGVLVLTESHLACHTYPEHAVATFNLYCCRARAAWPWAERLAEMLGALEVTVRALERGAAPARAATEGPGR